MSNKFYKDMNEKTVWAFKISKVDIKSIYDGEDYAILYPEDSTYSPIKVDLSYITRERPEKGGYYVRFNNGNEEFALAEVFEKVFTPINYIEK